jgi:hypothetical protein
MACPASLTTLIIEGVYLTCYGVPSNTASIRHLALNRTRLTSGLAECVEACFPTLSTLELEVSLSYDVTISLQDHQLDKLIVRFYHGIYGKRNLCLYKAMYAGDIDSLEPMDRTGLEWNSRVLKLICPSIKYVDLPN